MRKPATAETVNGLPNVDALGGGIDDLHTIAYLKAQPGRLRDRFGHFYPDRVLDNWSAKAIAAMRLHRVVEGGAMTKSYFALQAYRVLSNPVEKMLAVTDANTVRMLARIAAGNHDCIICRALLNIDPESDSSPGLVGYWHGTGIDAIAVTACVGCVLELGDEKVVKRIGQIFKDEILRDGEATIELVQGGVS